MGPCEECKDAGGGGFSSSLLLPSLELSDTNSMSLEYEPSSEPQDNVCEEVRSEENCQISYFRHVSSVSPERGT